MMDGATLLVRMLAAYDVRCVFGVPGDTNVALYAALSKQNDIRHVMARDERSAGFMADAYARVTNKPGVIEVPSGAGPLYAIAAVAEAHVSAAPVIIITNDNSTLVEGRGFIAELDCKRLFEPVTKASILLKHAAKIPETVRRAFRIATTGRPGAVHIAIPDNLYHEQVDPASVSMHVEAECRAFPAYPASPGRRELEHLRELIGAARRPVIVAGGGVNRSGANAALTAFAERWRVPVVTSITGQCAMVDDHELAIGVISDNGFHPHAARAVEESDLLIYLGCKVGNVVTMGWTFPPPSPERRIVQIDIDPEIIGNNTENTLSIAADARMALEALNSMPLPAELANDPAWVPTVNAWRAAYWTEVTEEQRAPADGALRGAAVIDALDRRLKGPQLLFSDPGTPTPFLCRRLRLTHPDSRLIMQRAFGGLGYALPAVVGGYFARPDLRPIGLFGDGSLGMSVGELETVARLRIPAILMNFNNASFAWIKALQQIKGHPAGMNVDFVGVDAAAIARAYGLKGIRVERFDELEPALDEAFATDGPVFLDLMVQSVADELPPVFNWMRKRGLDPLRVGGKKLMRPEHDPS